MLATAFAYLTIFNLHNMTSREIPLLTFVEDPGLTEQPPQK